MAERERLRNDVPEGVCCVCMHKLDHHVPEQRSHNLIWRCHSINIDAMQCECRLCKLEYVKDINYYDLRSRMKQWKLEMERALQSIDDDADFEVTR